MSTVDHEPVESDATVTVTVPRLTVIFACEAGKPLPRRVTLVPGAAAAGDGTTAEVIVNGTEIGSVPVP